MAGAILVKHLGDIMAQSVTYKTFSLVWYNRDASAVLKNAQDVHRLLVGDLLVVDGVQNFYAVKVSLFQSGNDLVAKFAVVRIDDKDFLLAPKCVQCHNYSSSIVMLIVSGCVVESCFTSPSWT